MTDKPTIPSWLNPDAILGAVEHFGRPYWVTEVETTGLVIFVGEDSLWIPEGGAEVPHNLRLRPDLHPVSPELAKLFEEGTDAAH